MHDIHSEKHLAQEFCVIWFKQAKNYQTSKSKILWIQQLMSWGVEFSRFTLPSIGGNTFQKLYCLWRQTALNRYCRHTPHAAPFISQCCTLQKQITKSATYSPSVRLLLQLGLIKGHAHCVIPPTSFSRLCFHVCSRVPFRWSVITTTVVTSGRPRSYRHRPTNVS
jgi:hypothetical protein